MAQFIELYSPGQIKVYIRCSAIERVEVDANLPSGDLASPNKPISLILRESQTRLDVYGCSVMDILHGIHRDDVFLDPRTLEE